MLQLHVPIQPSAPQHQGRPMAHREPLSEAPLGNKGKIIVASGYAGLDTERLRRLIEAGFGRKLVEGYFESPATSVILEEGYQGAAIIKDVYGVPCPYLDKFAVAPHMQGMGLGKALWESIKEHNPSLLWRAAAGNPCNRWYERNSDGSERHGEWIVYWYNMGPQTAKEAALAAAALPRTIIR